MMNRNFGDRLHAAVLRTGTCACIGLDPRPGNFPPELRPELGASRRQVADSIRRWAMEILAAVEGRVPVVKLQAACFEAWGPQGMEVFADVCNAAHARGLLVIGDVKRGDIGSSADLYAQGYLVEDSAFRCDAITVNPYLGMDSLSPFIEKADENGRGVFILCKTSNEQSADFQSWKDESGTSLAEEVARRVQEQSLARLGSEGYSNLGLVVGANYPEATQRMRELAPNSWLLLPGYGHQGGTAAGLEGARGANGQGILVSSSRGVTDAWQKRPELAAEEGGFTQAVQAAVAEMREDLQTLARA